MSKKLPADAITFQATLRVFNLTKEQLTALLKGWRRYAKKPFWSQKPGKERLLRESQIKAALQNQSQQIEPHRTYNGKVYLSARSIKADPNLGMGEATLRKAASRGEADSRMFPPSKHCPHEKQRYYEQESAKNFSGRLKAESSLNVAVTFLQEALGKGPVLRRLILVKAGSLGIATRTLRRAKAYLHVEPSHGTHGNPVYWSLPSPDGARFPEKRHLIAPKVQAAIAFLQPIFQDLGGTLATAVEMARQAGHSRMTLYRAARILRDEKNHDANGAGAMATPEQTEQAPQLQTSEQAAAPSLPANGQNGAAPAAMPRPVTPRWDAAERKLWLGNRLLKDYRQQPAHNQIKLLQAFQDAAWARSIPNPFTIPGPQGREQPDPDALRNTCLALKKTMPAGIIAIRRDGTGKNVIWENF